MDIPSGFYVYELIDPRDDRVFYIGKGQGRRAWQHEAAVRRGDTTHNPIKCKVIGDIINAGLFVQVRIVADYHLEEDALDHEFRLVDATPNLTNAMRGGLGKVASREEIRRRQRELSARIAERRIAAKAAARIRDHQRKLDGDAAAKNRLEKPAVAERHKDQVDAWAATVPSGVAAAMRVRNKQTERNMGEAMRREAVRKRRQMKQTGYFTDDKYPGMYFPADDHVLRRLFNR